MDSKKGLFVSMPSYSYEDSANRRKVRVYNDVNARLTLEDFFAKMKINFG